MKILKTNNRVHLKSLCIVKSFAVSGYDILHTVSIILKLLKKVNERSEEVYFFFIQLKFLDSYLKIKDIADEDNGSPLPSVEVEVGYHGIWKENNS